MLIVCAAAVAVPAALTDRMKKVTYLYYKEEGRGERCGVTDIYLLPPLLAVLYRCGCIVSTVPDHGFVGCGRL